MNIRRICVVLLSAVLVVACNRDARPFNPAAPDPASGPANWQDRIPWSPYMVIHNPGNALAGYREAVGELLAHGAIRGARVGISENEVMGNSPNAVTQWLASQGVELLVIVDNYLLLHDNLEEIMDRVIALHPGVTTFQIGNETTTIMAKNGPTLSIEQYMKAFRRIYNYVSVKYPNIILVSQSVFGSGTYGSNELEQMVALGLTQMSPQRVVIGMNVYGQMTVYANASVINSQLRNYRVWVTETGETNPELHATHVVNFYPLLSYRVWVTETGENDSERQIGHVINLYPELINQLRAERIYWYALWAGDSGTDVGFGLIRHADSPPILREPLFEILTGRR